MEVGVNPALCLSNRDIYNWIGALKRKPLGNNFFGKAFRRFEDLVGRPDSFVYRSLLRQDEVFFIAKKRLEPKDEFKPIKRLKSFWEDKIHEEKWTKDFSCSIGIVIVDDNDH